DPRPRPRRRADLRADPEVPLPAPLPRRGPAAVAHRPGLRAYAEAGGHPLHGASHAARRLGADHAAVGPPRPGGLGRGRRHLRPRPVPARAQPRADAALLQAVRHRRALLHRSPVRPARGRARARPPAPRLRPRARPGLPVADRGTAHPPAGGPHRAADPPRPRRRTREDRPMTATAQPPTRTSTADLDVLIVGAGLSGIGAAYRLQQMRPGTTYEILEA